MYGCIKRITRADFGLPTLSKKINKGEDLYMFRHSKKVLALIFAAVMVASVAGCKKSNTSSLSDEIEYVYVDGNSGGNAGNTDSGTQSGTQSGNSSKGNTGSGKTASGKNNGGSGKTVNDGVDPTKYKNTKVVFATWRDPKLNEDKKVVENFQKKYGITVDVDLIAEGGYTQTVLGRIASGNAPDVFFCTYAYPACLNALQPLDAAKLNLNESIWDQSLINATTVNGKKYLVNTVSNIWNDFDMIFYNKKIFKQNGIRTPEEYQKAGKWNFDTLKMCMTEVKKANSSYTGGILNYEGVINSTGESIVKMKNGRFELGINDNLKSVVKWIAEGRKQGYIGGLDAPTGQEEFKKGKVGIFWGFSWCLKKTGGLSGMNPDDIGFVTAPSWNGKAAVPATFVRGWGICRGAKNPVAAGIFLRYYLDVNNYNTTDAFINKEASDFFFKVSTKDVEKTNRYYCFGGGVGSVTEAFNTTYSAGDTDPTQVDQFFASNMNTYKAGVGALNDLLAKIK